MDENGLPLASDDDAAPSGAFTVSDGYGSSGCSGGGDGSSDGSSCCSGCSFFQ